MMIHSQNFYERHTGDRHEVQITFECNGRKVYEVRVDGEFYSTAESKVQAFDEVVDIIRYFNWSPLKPI